MIPLRQHNDIVQKLIKEIDVKEKQIKSMQKQKTKAQPQIPQLQPTAGEQNLNKKISQLNKQYKERISTLTQQLRNKSVQNKELKERLTIKKNIDAKQKDHIAQILKKTYDRKPSSAVDHKISALITHYQAQVDKKNKFIQSLHHKIKELQAASNSQKCIEAVNQNYKTFNESEQCKGISFTQHQKQINRIKTETFKYRKLFQQKQKQYKDLSRRYSELTNQYYKIVNSYGIEEDKLKSTKKLSQIKSEAKIDINPKNIQKRLKSNALQNLLYQMAYSESQVEEVQVNKKDFASKVARINTQANKLGKINKQSSLDSSKLSGQLDNLQKQQNPSQSLSQLKIQQIMQLLKIQDPTQLIPHLINITTRIQDFNILDTITRSLQVFFYNIGKGKLTRQELVPTLQDLQTSYNHNLEAVDLLDQICIVAGAKRERLKYKIEELMNTVNQYHNRLKSIKFTQELAKGNKVIQFIEFFQLEKEEVVLPQQLIKIQQQLKSIDKFVKEARVILQINQQSSHQTVLQLILRYLQKTSAVISHLQRKKQKLKPQQQ